MSSGKNCPSCGRDIGMWAVIRAPLPNRIRCPHCNSRLQYRISKAVPITAVLIGIAFAVGAIALDEMGVIRRAVVWGVGLAVMAVFELVIARYLRERRTLEVVEGA
jgi:DNA-directed RNA polymerase subunit RPC12/RpoP